MVKKRDLKSMGKKKKEEIIDDLNSRLNFKHKETSLREDFKKDTERLRDLKETHPQKYNLELEKFIVNYGVYYEQHEDELSNFIYDVPLELLGTFNPATGFPSIYGMTPEDDRAFEIAFRHLSRMAGMKIKINPGNRLVVVIDPNIPREILHFYLDDLLNKLIKNDKPSQRFRKEKINALEVWKARVQRKPFMQIAKEFGIKESAAKMRFRRAYEIIFDKKYIAKDFRKPEIKKEDLEKECSTCREKKTCTELCPHVMAYVDQDVKAYLREYLKP
jgi:hypothetical protein